LNSLLVFSLIAGIGGGTAQPVQPPSPVQSSFVQAKQPTGPLSVLGPNMAKNPRPLGILGVKEISGKYNLSDFVGSIAREGTTHATAKGQFQKRAVITALVLYDGGGTYGWIGSLYAYQIGNLLNHFGVSVTRKNVSNYTKGDLGIYTCAFYVGSQYGYTLPSSFKTEVVANTKPFCWLGYNLWEVAWNAAQTGWNNAFETNFGFEFSYLDGTGYPNVLYKGTTLTKQQFNPVQGDVTVWNPAIASVLATSTNGSGSQPYITRGANFWYVADNPLEYVPTNRGDDRYLAFCDILNDITGVPMPDNKPAIIRIEDVSAICDSKSLRGLADVMAANNAPFVVCVIPDYMDPLGVYNNGTPLEIQMQNSAQFISDLQYMQSKGGQLIMHGVSHQYSNVANPVNGVSAIDVEFFRVSIDANGVEQAIGPVTEDSTSWVTNRLAKGFSMMNKAGFASPLGWNTPHYFATPVDYKVFEKDFWFSMDRVLTYATNNASKLQYLIQPSPYTFIDEYANYRLPETIGYCDPNGTSGIINLPANMVGYANAVKCVRGGIAGMYYHWFLGPTMLDQLVKGVQAAGFTFTNPSYTLQ